MPTLRAAQQSGIGHLGRSCRAIRGGDASNHSHTTGGDSGDANGGDGAASTDSDSTSTGGNSSAGSMNGSGDGGDSSASGSFEHLWEMAAA